MKRILPLIAILAMLITLSACTRQAEESSEDTTLLQGIEVEDSIRFTLTVTGDDITMSSIQKQE